LEGRTKSERGGKEQGWGPERWGSKKKQKMCSARQKKKGLEKSPKGKGGSKSWGRD